MNAGVFNCSFLETEYNSILCCIGIDGEMVVITSRVDGFVVDHAVGCLSNAGLEDDTMIGSCSCNGAGIRAVTGNPGIGQRVNLAINFYILRQGSDGVAIDHAGMSNEPSIRPDSD